MAAKNVEKQWEAYYRANQGRTTSPLLRRSLGADCVPQGNTQAVDLGCGAGVETALLLNAGWHVLAIDKEPAAIARVEALRSAQRDGRLVANASRFEDLEALPSSALIHAGLSLPFCNPAGFPRFWSLIVSALEPGGVFVGHLFGDRHDWAGHPEMSFHAKEEIETLCSSLTIELLRETEGDGGLAPHHWHRFDLIARKS